MNKKSPIHRKFKLYSIKKIKIIEQKDKLFKHFEKYIKLNDELKVALIDKITFVSFKKGDLVHNADKYVQNRILYKKDCFALILLKTEKKLVNTFQQKKNGVIRLEVLEQEH